MLNLIAYFPSANAINSADVKEIEAFLKGRGRAPKLIAKDIKALAKEHVRASTLMKLLFLNDNHPRIFIKEF